VLVGVEVGVEDAIATGVLVETVTASGVESSDEISAQPVSRNRRIANVRNRRIIPVPEKGNFGW